MMNSNFKFYFLKCIVALFILPLMLLAFGCRDRSLFTELEDNRLEVIFKGTYESNSPRGWQMGLYTHDSTEIEDNSVDDYPDASNDTKPTKIMLDIAEMRLNGVKFSNYRHTLTFGLNDSDAFFSGSGVVLKNDDPFDGGDYDTVQIFFRKMLFDGAVKYTMSSSGWQNEAYEDMFEEVDIPGIFNYNQFQVNSYYDSLRLEEDSINKVFPLEVPIIGGLHYDKNNEKTVLEIRIIVKDFIKKYEYDGYKEGEYYLLHYYAFSDWLRKVEAGENTIGGNMLAVARAYVPGNVGSISVTNAALGTATNVYIIAIPVNDAITDYTIPNINRGDDDNESVVDDCDLPNVPATSSSYIEPMLDYYLKYEKYKYDWQTIKDNSRCPGTTEYESLWAYYENEMLDFKIPPLVAWSQDADVNIENVPQGEYKIYYSTNDPTYGSLFEDSDFTYISNVTVTVGSASPVTTP